MITADGFMLTNAHVVGRPCAGAATFPDGRELEGVVGVDPLSDLAVLRRGSGGCPPPSSATPRRWVGQLVVAIGKPPG